MEVDEFQVFAHVLLVLDLLFCFQDLDLVGDVLRLKLVNVRFLLLKFIEHVL